MKYNIEERSKYAKQLLLKVRLPLLSEHALKYIIDKILSFSYNNDYMSDLKEIITKTETNYQNNTIRYCSQNKFNILLYGGYYSETKSYVKGIHQLNERNLNNVKLLPSMTTERENFSIVCLEG